MSKRRRRRAHRERTVVTVLIVICALLAGFAAGRLSADVSISSLTQLAGDGETTEEETSLAGTAAAEESDGVSDEVGQQEETSEDSDETAEEETEEETEEGEESEEEEEKEEEETEDADNALVDAADMEYDTGSSESAEVITHEAVTSVGSEVTVVDVSTIEDVTLQEAYLPDGYASTLYGKTGEAMFQIVVFGDSQFANFVDEEGMAYLLSQKLHANVYNLAIGGKTASVDPEEEGNTDINSWEEACGVSMVKAVCGLADAESVFSGWDYQLNVFNSCDFSQTDLFIIEFGVNDYLNGREMANTDNLYNYFTLYGALDQMVTDLRVNFEDAHVLVVTPTYAQFWESGTGAFLGDSNIVSNYYGTLVEYAETVSHVASAHSKSGTVDAYQESGVNIYNAPEDLLDGIHLTYKGRQKYISLLGRAALHQLGYEIAEDVDPDSIDWISQDVERD